MSADPKIEKMSDDELDAIAGGVSQDYLVAMDVMNGKYGNGEDRKRNLEAAGYNYNKIQGLVNGLSRGYDKVAMDVIRGCYGNGQARIDNLYRAGYDGRMVQDIVNEIMR